MFLQSNKRKGTNSFCLNGKIYETALGLIMMFCAKIHPSKSFEANEIRKVEFCLECHLGPLLLLLVCFSPLQCKQRLVRILRENLNDFVTSFWGDLPQEQGEPQQQGRKTGPSFTHSNNCIYLILNCKYLCCTMCL